MRNAILTLLAATSAIAAYAHPISPGEAKSIAAEFFNASSGSKRAPKAVEMTWTDSKSQELQPYYIFNTEGDNGFVIVSGDTRAKKILGYSDKGSFGKDNIPPQLEWLLSQYEKSMESLPANAPTPRQNITRSAEQNYLLTTQWGQGEPYNAKCPVLYGGRAVTGCVATAMAQIINYENKTSHVEAIPGYQCAVDMPDLPSYEFNYGHLDNYDIATLMLYCGQSVRMDYDPIESGSSIYSVPEALQNYFGWETGIRVIERDHYNDEHWNRMVKEEVAKGHPLLYAAIGEPGSHAFVLDGFIDDLYHVNWGWDGYLDGYYSFQPFDQDHKSDFINMQRMVTLRDDDPFDDIITYGTIINGINYELRGGLTAAVLPMKDGDKYSGDLVIPSHVDFEGRTYTVNYFASRAFVDCEHLESISIPATIIGHAGSIFEGCENLHKVNVEDIAAFIRLDVGAWGAGSPFCYGGDLYLNGELVKDLVIPEGVESIGYFKFANCWSIESIIMPSTLKEVGQSSFAGCTNLKIVDMRQSSLETIGLGAFANNGSIEEISFPSKLKNITGEAFTDCKNLRKIVSLATTPMNILPGLAADNAFDELHHSETILYVPDEAIEQYRQAKEWCMFVDIRPRSQEQPLPSTISMSDDQFTYEINLTDKFAKVTGHLQNDISIPASVEYDNQTYPITAIGYNALFDTRIEQLNAPLTKIGISSFILTRFDDKCELLSTLQAIPYHAFINANIPRLILPECIQMIGREAFGFQEKWVWNDGEDDSLHMEYEKIISTIESRNPNPPLISEDTFDPVTYAETLLLVPYGSKKAYTTAPGWRNFSHINNIGEEQENTFENDLTISASRKDDLGIRDGMPLNVSVTVRNSGVKNVAGFILAWQIDGQFLGEKHYDMELQSSEVITFEEKIIASIQSGGKHDLKLIVTIDGVEDQDSSDNEVILTFESFEKGYYRVSLFEQFTSESCSLTPQYAPQIASAIQNSGYSDFLAQVTHHCGFYDDFLTLNHDYEWFYNDEYNTFTPAIMINRTDINETDDTPVCEVPADLDYKIIKEAGICDALISVHCDVVGDNVIVKTLLEKNEDFNLDDGYNYLTVFLLEDSIPAREQRPIGTKDYIHRNTLRKILSSTWGDRIIWNDNICAIKYNSEVDPEWNKDNLKAVAFIHRYNPTSPIGCQVYTANSSDLPQYGSQLDDSEYKDAIVYVNSITLTPDNISCSVGESFNVEATVLPVNADNKELYWTSSNVEVAIVDAVGKVTAVGKGEAILTATPMDGSSVSASCLITVYEVEADEVIIHTEVYSGRVGDSFIVTATVLPENTTDKSITWDSFKEEYAKISNNGNDAIVEIVGVGKTWISAHCAHLYDSFQLYCYPKIGDSDWNGVVTIADAVDIANYVVEKKPIDVSWSWCANTDEWLQFYTMGANANGSPDNAITFADAFATVSIALEQPPYEAISHLPNKSEYLGDRSVDTLVIRNIQETPDGYVIISVSLDNTIDYVALQADITLPEGMAVETINKGNRLAGAHNLTTRIIDKHSIRLAIFDLNNSIFAHNDESIFEIVAKVDHQSSEAITISNIIAANKDAKEYILSSSDLTSDVEAIFDTNIRIVSENNGISLFNAASKKVVVAKLDGQIFKTIVPESDYEIITLPSGIYIVKVGGEKVKCIVR